jgi:flavin prenyltransferase
MKRKIIVAVTGASGAIYARILFEKLKQVQDQFEEIAVLFTDNAADIWKYELKEPFHPVYPFRVYEKDDFYAPFASGSSGYDTMFICPCSMGTLARIANGISDCLITRAADVILKERRKLILVPRETPYNLVHVENMKRILLTGGMICPASPSFYSKPETMDQLAATVVERLINLAEIPYPTFSWGNSGHPEQ